MLTSLDQLKATGTVSIVLSEIAEVVKPLKAFYLFGGKILFDDWSYLKDEYANILLLFR